MTGNLRQGLHDMKTIEKTTSGTDLAGRTYGQLTVLESAGMMGHFDYWKCKCTCGNERNVMAYRLMTNRTKSCGCLRVELLRNRATKHGAYQQAEYGIYCAAKVRCTNPTHISYKYYGERGIEFRFNSFEEFIAEVGERPSKTHSIDRIDVNGHYEKGNVRWATPTEQMANRRQGEIPACLVCGVPCSTSFHLYCSVKHRKQAERNRNKEISAMSQTG